MKQKYCDLCRGVMPKEPLLKWYLRIRSVGDLVCDPCIRGLRMIGLYHFGDSELEDEENAKKWTKFRTGILEGEDE